MDWVRESHCSWQSGDMRIVQNYCPREGGTVFKLFDGERVRNFWSLEEAQNAAFLEAMSNVQ